MKRAGIFCEWPLWRMTYYKRFWPRAGIECVATKVDIQQHRERLVVQTAITLSWA